VKGGKLTWQFDAKPTPVSRTYRLRLDYTLQDVRPPSPELVETMCQLFRDEGLPAY